MAPESETAAREAPERSLDSGTAPKAPEGRAVDPQASLAQPGLPPPPVAPWWHSKLVITAITVVGASIAPLTTWVSSEQERALEQERYRNAADLQQQRQQHAIRVEFFEKVVSPTIEMTPEARLEALRYFRSVLPAGDLRKWAELEYDSLQALVAEQREAAERAQQREAEAAAAGERMEEALSELETAPSVADEHVLEEVDRHVRLAKEQAAAAKQAMRAVEQVEKKIKARLPKPAASPRPSVAATPGSDAVAAAVAPARPAAQASPAPPPRFRFRATQTYLSKTDTSTFYRFTAALDASPQELTRIARVEYLFDHPTFRQKTHASADPSSGFEVSYRGWGCLTDVHATVTLIDGEKLERSFDMCALLR